MIIAKKHSVCKENVGRVLLFLVKYAILYDNAVCFGAYGQAGPVRRWAVNHVRRGTEQH